MRTVAGHAEGIVPTGELGQPLRSGVDAYRGLGARYAQSSATYIRRSYRNCLIYVLSAERQGWQITHNFAEMRLFA